MSLAPVYSNTEIIVIVSGGVYQYHGQSESKMVLVLVLVSCGTGWRPGVWSVGTIHSAAWPECVNGALCSEIMIFGLLAGTTNIFGF